jgi:hypothetical protein
VAALVRRRAEPIYQPPLPSVSNPLRADPVELELPFKFGMDLSHECRRYYAPNSPPAPHDNWLYVSCSATTVEVVAVPPLNLTPVARERRCLWKSEERPNSLVLSEAKAWGDRSQARQPQQTSKIPRL